MTSAADAPRPPFTAILLDLDGTITDSAPGITDTLAYTYEQLGMAVPAYDELLRWVGPPIMDSFRDLAGMDQPTAERALEIYRARYLDRGAYDSTLYPGMGLLVRDIADAGIPLSLATSKPELPATLMLEHFTIAQCFTVITGASADETRSEKADVVEEALRRLRDLDVSLDNVVMIGDRIHDIEGAAEHGVPTIAVEWGYGTDDERDHAALVASTTDELRSLLGLPAAVEPAA
ncbi:MAG: HAD hydrolase-like protein [Actinomycetes bacterium]